MFQTLFGGALLIVVIYYVLRLFGVANFWRGVLSGIIPVLGYLVLSVVHWPGGDVISMHVAVYLATATVLTLIGDRGLGEGRKLHWVPKTIIVFFMILFVIDGTLMLISGQGVPPSIATWLLPKAQKPVHTAFSGVVPHGEEAANSINQFLAQTDRQRRLGWTVTVSGLENPALGQTAAVAVKVLGPDGHPLRGALAGLALLRPGQARAVQTAPLTETDPGVYRGNLSLAEGGHWVAAVRLQLGKDRYESDQTLEIPQNR